MKTRLALVSQNPLVPVKTGNRARVLALAKELVFLGYEVVFIQIPSFDGDEAGDRRDHEALVEAGNFYDISKLSPIAAMQTLVVQKAIRGFKKIQKYLNIETDQKYREPLDFRVSLETCKKISRIVADRDIKICIVEYVCHSLILNHLPGGVTKIVDTHDIFSNRHLRFQRNGLPFGFWLSLSPEDEVKGLRRSDAILAIQADEGLLLTEMINDENAANPSVGVVSHFLDIADTRINSPAPDRAALACSNNSANLEGYFSFLENILPLILAESSHFRLVVAGGICASIPDHPFVEKFGPYGQIEDVFELAPVAINPVVSGTGVAIKVLEALSCGIPVVTTLTGGRGLTILQGEGVYAVADNDFAGFARHICRLTQNTLLRDKDSSKAYISAQAWNSTQRNNLIQVLNMVPTRTTGLPIGAVSRLEADSAIDA